MKMREKLLTFLTFLATKHRKLVFVVSLVLTLGLGAACGLVKLDMRWSELLPESMPVVKEFRKIDENFLQPGNMIIAISGSDPVMLEKITDEATEILQEKLVCEKDATVEECRATELYARYVYGKMPEKWLTDHALQLAKPKDVERIYNILRDPRLLPYLTHLNDDLEAEYTESENVKNKERQIVASLDAIQELLTTIDSATGENVSEEQIARTVRDLTIGRPYMFSLDNSVSLVMVASAIPADDFETLPLMDRKIEKLLAPLSEKYPDYRIERTGIIAIGRDEMDSVGVYTYIITLIALVIVFLLLIWNFRSALTPILALIPIVVGIIWTVGIIGLTLGTMNIFTMMIMVVLLGLGIDFSIHIANRFHEEIAARKSVEESLKLAIGKTGVGVVTGAVTTAVAFLALMIADTKGIRQFGLCSGIGVLTTLMAVMLILPSLLAYREVRQSRKATPDKPAKKARDFGMLGSIAEFMGNKRKMVIEVCRAKRPSFSRITGRNRRKVQVLHVSKYAYCKEYRRIPFLTQKVQGKRHYRRSERHLPVGKPARLR
jgi:predicted RND superfamily exporter protein